MSNKIAVWTHYDLDGVVSYLVVRWLFPQFDMQVIPSNPLSFRDDFCGWLVKNDLDDFAKIFVLDMNVSNDSDLIDRENVTIIDHHSDHVDNIEKYEKAHVHITEYTSAAKLIYKVMKNHLENVELTDAQKKLILLTDDYDCYKLEHPDSKKLNTIFWQSQNSFFTFIDNFKHGFKGFTKEQEYMWKFFLENLEEAKEKSPYFIGEGININGESVTVISTVLSDGSFTNDMAEYILEELNADIAIVLKKSNNRISMRRSHKTGCTVKLNKLAAKIMNGGGHDFAAGGEVCPEFLEFSKLLRPLKK